MAEVTPGYGETSVPLRKRLGHVALGGLIAVGVGFGLMEVALGGDTQSFDLNVGIF